MCDRHEKRQKRQARHKNILISVPNLSLMYILYVLLLSYSLSRLLQAILSLSLSFSACTSPPATLSLSLSVIVALACVCVCAKHEPPSPCVCDNVLCVFFLIFSDNPAPLLDFDWTGQLDFWFVAFNLHTHTGLDIVVCVCAFCFVFLCACVIHVCFLHLPLSSPISQTFSYSNFTFMPLLCVCLSSICAFGCLGSLRHANCSNWSLLGEEVVQA